MPGSYNFAVIRELIESAFAPEDFSNFCFDYFHDVEKHFTRGQSYSEQVKYLINYAETLGQLDELLDKIRTKRPVKYNDFASQLYKLAPSGESSGGHVFMGDAGVASKASIELSDLQIDEGYQAQGTVSWVDEANASLTRRGRLRTAFPTDLSFTELVNTNLFVEPRVSSAGFDVEFGRNTHPVGNEFLLDDVLLGLIRGDCYLLLGEPGSGKSFLSYLLQSRLQERGYPALACDLLDLLSLVNDRKQVFEPWGGLDTLKNFPVIIDGLDEPSLTGQELQVARLFAEKLVKRGSVLCICRREDYETRVFRMLHYASFDKILYVAEWRPQIEVTQFVERLEGKGYIKAQEFLAALKHYPSLQALVRRPLHARMLTFVWPGNVTSLQEDGAGLTHLYEEYFYKCATATTPRDGTMYSRDVVNTWAVTAWTLFSRSLYTRSRIEASVLEDITVKMPLALQRAARSLLQYTANPGRTAHQFIHYSFYEFLVATYFVFQLCKTCELRDFEAATTLFHRDMTREIRHYAVNLMATRSASIAHLLAPFLEQLYSFRRGMEPLNEQTLSTCNLIVYFLARCSDDQASSICIRRLLDSEADPFLRTSLYWAACKVNNVDMFFDYYRNLQTDARMRELNRGYHLYYYGDLDRALQPPYSDNSPEAPWPRTRTSMVELISRNSTQLLCQRLLDVATFLDFVQYHRTHLMEEEYAVLTTALSTFSSVGREYEQTAAALRRDIEALISSLA